MKDTQNEIKQNIQGTNSDRVIKMLTELIELGQKMKEQMKDTQSEIKQNIQGTSSDRKETRTQRIKGKNKHPMEQNEETRIQKNENRLLNLWAT